MTKYPARYPKPGPVGGRLIREMVAFFREQGVQLPLTSHILIAVSGGIDSVALGHCLVRYGRRIVPSAKIRLIHINHGWRGSESDGDASFVKRLGRDWGVPVTVKKLRVNPVKGASLEDAARDGRQEIYKRVASQYEGPVITAHQADDLAETLIWRLFTGASQTHGGGIAFQYENEMRPLLRIRKKILMNYLKEEAQEWRDDRTNHEGRFLRSKMRLLLMPTIESLFPRAVQHLVDAGLAAMKNQLQSNLVPGPLDAAFFAARCLSGEQPRRAHWEVLLKNLKKNSHWKGEVHLPGAWKIRREAQTKCLGERWVLEKT